MDIFELRIIMKYINILIIFESNKTTKQFK